MGSVASRRSTAARAEGWCRLRDHSVVRGDLDIPIAMITGWLIQPLTYMHQKLSTIDAALHFVAQNPH